MRRRGSRLLRMSLAVIPSVTRRSVKLTISAHGRRITMSKTAAWFANSPTHRASSQIPTTTMRSATRSDRRELRPISSGAGEWLDTSLALQYFRARWYRPTNGRFLSSDKFEGEAQSPATLWKYAYAEANPVDKQDPFGYLARSTAGFRNIQVVAIRFDARPKPFLVRPGVAALAGGGVLAFFFGEPVWNALFAISKAASAIDNANRLHEEQQGRKTEPLFLSPCALPMSINDQGSRLAQRRFQILFHVQRCLTLAGTRARLLESFRATIRPKP